VPRSGAPRPAAGGTGPAGRQGGSGFDELLEPAVFRRAIRPPAEKTRRLSQPATAITSCHGFVKIDVKSYVTHGRQDVVWR
jgi:hypothetical protein